VDTEITSPPGRGLDFGTQNLVAASLDADGGVKIRRDRTAFLELPADTLGNEEMLTQLGVPYVLYGDRLFVLGNAPSQLKNLAGAKPDRTVPGGVLSPRDQDAIAITNFLFDRILGPPVVEDEPLTFCMPSSPCDWDFDEVIHEGIVAGLLRKRGYAPTPITESGAVVLAGLADSGFTGVAISFGHGRVDACVARDAEPLCGFSVDRGGAWVDASVSRIMGVPLLEAAGARTGGLDIESPGTRLQQAVARYYRNLVRYVMTNLRQRVEFLKDKGGISESVPVVLAGGASLPAGFVGLCSTELEVASFPLEIADVRRAEAPRTSVARGCLLAAVTAAEVPTAG